MSSQASNSFEYRASMPIPPGDTVREILENKGIKQAELAHRMGRPLKFINEIIKGKTAITAETALQLEQVLGVSAKVWMNLEANFQETKARIKAEGRLAKEIEKAGDYPYLEMVKLGWVSAAKTAEERAGNLLSYFGVTSFENIIENYRAEPALYRISKKSTYSVGAVVAWLRKGMLDAQKIQVQDYDDKKLKDSAEILRAQTMERPEIFDPKIKDILAGCGVAFVVTPSLKNAPINGAARWMTTDKALIQLSIRYSYSDIFWFTLFHEIGHILHDGKKDFSIDMARLNGEDEKEIFADQFASDALINKQAYQEFVAMNKFDAMSVKAFASEQRVHPGIVVGRLQHDKHIGYQQLHSLRDRFKWVDG